MTRPERLVVAPRAGLAGAGRGTNGAMTTALSRQVPRIPVARPREDGGSAAPATPVRTGRSLAGYLVMPRPGDAVKALLMPATFGLGVLADGGADGRTVLRALLVLVVLEFLVYPARYQWNDIRGFAADQRHPGESDRGRLPGPLSMARRRIAASAAVAVLRLLAAVLIAFLPGLALGGLVLAVITGVFGVAAVYETVRAVATGHHDGDGAPPVTPAVALLWLTVGAGYAVRGLIGLALAVDLRDRPMLGVAAAVTLWTYGIAFVTSRWAVESLAFARLDDGRVNWSADASHAREHLLALTRWLPSTRADGAIPEWAPVHGRTPVRAPWNVAVAVSGAAAATTGVLLSTTDAGPAAWLLAGLGAAASLAVVCLPGRRPLAAAAGAAVLLVALIAASVPTPLVALLPWLAVTTAYLHFSAQCQATMGYLGRTARGAVTRALSPLVRLVVGDRTWQAITVERPGA